MSGSLSPLTPEQATRAIENTVKAVMKDLYDPHVTSMVERRVDEKLHDHVRYILNHDGLLWPVRRVWRWRSWELSLGRRRRA